MRESDLFRRALDIQYSGARAAFLDQACADDPVLRQAVERERIYGQGNGFTAQGS